MVDSFLTFLPLKICHCGQWIGPANYRRCPGRMNSQCMWPWRMYSIQRFQPLFYRLANNEKQGVRSHTVSVSGKAHKKKNTSLFIKLADVQADFSLAVSSLLATWLLTFPRPELCCLCSAVSKEKLFAALLCSVACENSQIRAVTRGRNTSKQGGLSIFSLSFVMK